MSDEFPDILPDDEFERRLQERHKAERALSTGQAGWNRRVSRKNSRDSVPFA